MSQRYTVTALDRRTMGHPNYFRAGRSWPSGQEVEVEVLDQDDDPTETSEVKGEKRVYPHPTKIGRTSWKAIVNDKQLIKQPVGATVDEALKLQSEYDQVKAELARTATRAELAETALAERNAGVDRLLGDLGAARDKIYELEAQLEQLTAPPRSAADEQPPSAPQPKAQSKAASKRGG